MPQQTYSANELMQALSEDRFKGPGRQLLGIVKPSERADHIAFSRQGCGHFVDIPAAMIASADEIGWSPCDDHGHPVMRLHLHEPKNAEAKILLDLLLQSQPTATFAGTMPPGLMPGGAGLPAGLPANLSANVPANFPPALSQAGLQRSATGAGRWQLPINVPKAATDCPAAICDACCCLVFIPNPGGGCLVYFICSC